MGDIVYTNKICQKRKYILMVNVGTNLTIQIKRLLGMSIINSVIKLKHNVYLLQK